MKNRQNICFLFLGYCFLSIGCATTPPSQLRTARIEYRPPAAPKAEPAVVPQPETINPFAQSERREARLTKLPRLAPIQEIGWLYRPPRGWTANQPRSQRLINDTNFTMRIFLDGQELNLVTAGTIALMPVDIGGVVRPKAMAPPRAAVYHLGDPGEHTIIIELYDGPAPLKYVKTCKINVNFTRQPNIDFSYRPCYESTPSL